MLIPGLYNGRSKTFFFINYEQVRFPNSFTRTRTVLNQRALDGWFRYQVGSSVREINVLQLAAANGQLSAKDPTTARLLQQIESSMLTTGTRSALADPLLDQYVYLSPGKLFEHQPTIRMDQNIGASHRLSGSFSTITARRDPDYLNSSDPRFPGAPNYRIYESTRPLFSLSLRSTLGSSLVNELRGGGNAFYGSSYFGKPESNGPQTFEDENGFAIDFETGVGLTNWYLPDHTELAERADLQPRRHGDVAARQAQHELRRIVSAADGAGKRPAAGQPDQPPVQPGLRPRPRVVHDGQLPVGLVRAAQ